MEISFENGKVIIKPAPKLGGILKNYAFKGKNIEEIFQKEKEAIITLLRYAVQNLTT